MYYPPFGTMAPQNSKKPTGNFFVPKDWAQDAKRPRGIDFRNYVYFVQDAMPAKNAILWSTEEVLHMKEFVFFLIWRYQKTYTRELYEQVHGKTFVAFQDFLDNKRASLEGISGLFQGIAFGDKQYKFKMSFFVGPSVPMQFHGAKIVIALTVDKVCGPTGNPIKNPTDMANAYKELKTIFGQELDYMGQNPAFQKKT